MRGELCAPQPPAFRAGAENRPVDIYTNSIISAYKSVSANILLLFHAGNRRRKAGRGAPLFLSAVHASETSARRGFAARHARALPYLSVRSRVSATRPPPSFFTPACPALAAACLYASFPALFPPCKWPLWDPSRRAQFRPAFCVRPRLFCRSARRPRLPRNASCFASVAYAAQVPSFSMRAVRSGPPRRAAARLVSRRAAPRPAVRLLQ